MEKQSFRAKKESQRFQTASTFIFPYFLSFSIKRHEIQNKTKIIEKLVKLQKEIQKLTKHQKFDKFYILAFLDSLWHQNSI